MVILPVRFIRAVFKLKTISLRWLLSALLRLKWSVNFKGRDCISHVLQCLAGMQEHMDNSCKWRAKYLRHSFVIVHTERSQWQASFIRKKSAYFVEVSVTKQILRKCPNPQKSWGNWACANSVYQALVSPPTHLSLGMRLPILMTISLRCCLETPSPPSAVSQ